MDKQFKIWITNKPKIMKETRKVNLCQQPIN